MVSARSLFRLNPFGLALAPGIHDIAPDEYHSDPCETPSLSNHVACTLLKQSPMHAWMEHPRLNPSRTTEKVKNHYSIGTCAHRMLLEGDDSGVLVVDAKDWRTKLAQEQRDGAAGRGLVALLAHEMQEVRDMVRAAHTYLDGTPLRGIFAKGKPEQTIIWNDAGGVLCRGKLDWLGDDRTLVVDYKTTSVENPGQFIRTMTENGYHTQSELYLRGLAALGHSRARFLFLVQETSAPYLCYLVECGESMRELASKQIARALLLWRDCLAGNRWPGYPGEVYQAEPPMWAFKDEEAAS